jgi:2',3'-cyclic-nucleotide 2'-phosphodiesterase (5'-nucleotidase family)
MIRQWRAEQEELLVLDAGDLLYPTVAAVPVEAQRVIMHVKAMAIVDAFNHMGCDAITIGDDDLLFGSEDLLKILNQAAFPVVSANLIDAGSGDSFFQPYVIRKLAGLRVGIFGLSGEPRAPLVDRFDGLTVSDPFEIAGQTVAALRDKSDIIVLLSHLGYAKDMELARKIDGIHFIVGGHTGVNLSHPRIIRNTVVLQVAKKGTRLGRIDIKIRGLSRSFVNAATREMLRRRLGDIKVQLESLGEEGPQDSARSRRQREMLKQRGAEMERVLASQENANEVINRIIPLHDEIPADTECQKILDPYLNKISQAVSASVTAAQVSSGSSAAE